MKLILLTLSTRRRHIFIYIALIIITLLFMLPRLLSPQFGLLDDGMSIITSKAFVDNPEIVYLNQINSGRIIPTYWLSMTVFLQIAQYSPLGIYIIKWLILYLTVFLFFTFLRWRGMSMLGSFICCCLFVFSVPSIENYYTLSKAEPIMMLWVLIGFTMIAMSFRFSNHFYRILLYFVAGISFLLAFFAKETSVVMLVISLLWVFTGWKWKSSKSAYYHHDKMKFTSTVIFFLTLFVPFIIWVISRQQILGNIQQKGYSAYYQISSDSFFIQGWKWIGYLIRDHIYLLPLSVLLFFSSIREKMNIRLLFDSFIWMGAWVVILLPWKALDMYYTLPFSLGSSIIGGHLISTTTQTLITDKKCHRRIITLILILSVILISFTQINNFTQARLQLLIDKTNESMVNHLANLKSVNPIFINSPLIEYINETRIHLSQIHNRQDHSIDTLDFTNIINNDSSQFWVVTPIVDKMPLPSVRSSLQNEPGVKQWNLCIEDLISNRSISSNKFISRMTWTDIGLNRFLPNVGLPDPLSNQMYEAIFLHNEIEYGWEIYEIQIDNSQKSLPGSFDQGVWNLSRPDGLLTKLTFGLSGDFPLVGDFDGNNYSDLAVYRETTNEFYIDLNLDSKFDLTIQLVNMQEGDYPIVGDWNGDGVDTLGFFRPTDFTWNLVNENITKNTTEQYFIVGVDPNALPLTGDWDGDGYDTFGTYIENEGVFVFDNVINPENGFRQRLHLPVSSNILVGDWFGIGIDTPAVVKNGEWIFYPTNMNCDYPNPLPVVDKRELKGIAIGGVWDVP